MIHDPSWEAFAPRMSLRSGSGPGPVQSGGPVPVGLVRVGLVPVSPVPVGLVDLRWIYVGSIGFTSGLRRIYVEFTSEFRKTHVKSA